MGESRPRLPRDFDVAPVVAILRRLPSGDLEALIDALVGAGVVALEVTIESEGAAEAIEHGRERHPSVAFGAGTVVDAASMQRALDAGAQFLVSPHTDAELIAAAAAEGVPFLPGAATATEALTAWRAGAAAVKLFPAGSLGVATLRALRDPLPEIGFVAVGGIGIENARSFLEAGALGVGVGSWLAAGGDAGEAGHRARRLLASLRPS